MTELDLDLFEIISAIPKEAVSLKVAAQIIIDSKLTDVHTELSLSDIHDRRNIGDDYNAEYCLTDEGSKYLEELDARRTNS